MKSKCIKHKWACKSNVPIYTAIAAPPKREVGGTQAIAHAAPGGGWPAGSSQVIIHQI